MILHIREKPNQIHVQAARHCTVTICTRGTVWSDATTRQGNLCENNDCNEEPSRPLQWSRALSKSRKAAGPTHQTESLATQRSLRPTFGAHWRPTAAELCLALAKSSFRHRDFARCYPTLRSWRQILLTRYLNGRILYAETAQNHQAAACHFHQCSDSWG